MSIKELCPKNRKKKTSLRINTRKPATILRGAKTKGRKSITTMTIAVMRFTILKMRKKNKTQRRKDAEILRKNLEMFSLYFDFSLRLCVEN